MANDLCCKRKITFVISHSGFAIQVMTESANANSNSLDHGGMKISLRFFTAFGRFLSQLNVLDICPCQSHPAGVSVEGKKELAGAKAIDGRKYFVIYVCRSTREHYMR